MATLLADNGVPVAMAPDDDSLSGGHEIEALLAVATVWVPVATANGAESLSGGPLAKAMQRIALGDPSRHRLYPVWFATENVAQPVGHLKNAEAAVVNVDAMLPPHGWHVSGSRMNVGWQSNRDPYQPSDLN